MATPTAIVAYLALFATVAALFLFVNLLVGKLVRPKLPNEEKLEVYECGEPVIGSSFVQFDLRFYVVALLFIIFDVEVAFFFPWATVFGKSVQLTSQNMPVVVSDQEVGGSPSVLTEAATIRLQELGVTNPAMQVAGPLEDPATIKTVVQDTAQQIAITSFADIAVFFAVLLVGFAYVWRRGDLDWVRTIASQKGEVVERAPPRNVGEQRSSGSILST
jgi:NADH-quinone oxidoreductase subunit A